MKANKLILGMISVTLMASTVLAAPAAKVREVVSRAKIEYFGGRGEHTGLAGPALRTAQDKMIADLRLEARDATVMRAALNNPRMTPEQRNTRLNALAHIAAVKKFANELADNAADAAVLRSDADVLLLTLKNSIFTNAKAPQSLNAAEHADAIKAVNKIEQQIPSMLTRMSKAERAEYAKIEKARDQIIKTERVSGAEALVKAIMAVKKVDKNGALAYIRRIIDCV